MQDRPIPVDAKGCSIAVSPRPRALAARCAPWLALATLAAVTASASSTASGATARTAADRSGGFGIAAGGDLQFRSPAELARELDGYVEVGARWVRFDFNWSGIERQRGVYDWSRHDAVVQAAHERGLRVLGLLAYTPAWARPAGTSNKFPPTKAEDFAGFVEQVVRRYARAGVHHWEVWNEPNHAAFWQPCPSIASYTALLRVAYEAAKKADPKSFVVSGGLAPATDNGCNVAPRTFLAGLYAAGARGSFDALGHHPYSFPAEPGTAHEWSAWHQMARGSPSLRTIMARHGDRDKQLWGTEWGAKIGTVSEEAQASALRQALALFRSYSWAGPLFVYAYRDHDSFGLVRRDWSRRPAWHAYQEAAAGP
jgi:polysaccharide biosynthesis protein PslG